MVVLKSLPESTASGWRMFLTGRRGLIIAAKLLLSSVFVAGSAWAAEFDEYAVKAAYLYNFAKFVEWPPETFATDDAPLRICVAGDNPFGDALASLSGKKVASHPVEVRVIPATANFNPCHIVFISRSEQGRFKALLTKLHHLPILTVSDIGDFAKADGIIGLIEADQRIRFNINLPVARQAGLKLSSQLLKLANIVEQE